MAVIARRPLAHQPHQGVGIDPQPVRFHKVALNQFIHRVHFLNRNHFGEGLADEHPLAGPRHQQPARLQFQINPVHCIAVDAKLGGHIPD
jgi:hypothetical protein